MLRAAKCRLVSVGLIMLTGHSVGSAPGFIGSLCGHARLKPSMLCRYRCSFPSKLLQRPRNADSLLRKLSPVRPALVTDSYPAIFHLVNPIAGFSDDWIMSCEQQSFAALFHDPLKQLKCTL
jgi:hypothetical protein